MSAGTVARCAVLALTLGFCLVTSAAANDAGHKMAEKFAGPESKQGEGARKATAPAKKDSAKTVEDKRKQDEKAALARKAAERKAQEARKRKAAEEKRLAAERARLIAEQRAADEADMLARARREAEESRAAEEHERLAAEARRLLQEAEAERAKAEQLLSSQAPKTDDPPVANADDAKAQADAALAQQRMEETRRLAEKLKRVRQIRDARLAAQARRAEQAQAAAQSTPPPPAPAAEASPPVHAQTAQPPADVPSAVAEASPAKADPVVPAAEQASPAPPLLPPPVAAPAPATVVEPRPEPEPEPAKSVGEMPSAVASAPPHATPAPPTPAATRTGQPVETRVTVLLVMEPGSYGIRRGGPRIADPLLCVSDGCYVSAGPDQTAVFLRGRKALGVGNTLGGRAGACRGALGCVFRGVELGALPAYLQPVDMHIFKHDRRRPQVVQTDSACSAGVGRLVCTQGVYADDYVMWIVPESVAEAIGPAALQRAVAEGLNGPRSAELSR
jgi:hypothetical protein